MINNSHLYIEFISNSSIGIDGNIGYRISFIIDYIQRKKIYFRVIARYSSNKYIKFCRVPPAYIILSRALNFLRIYLVPEFNSKFFDNYIFSYYICMLLIFRKFPENKNKILHITEYLPKVIQAYKNRGFKIILDVPIAPLKVSEKLNLKFDDQIFNVRIKDVEIEKSCFNLADIIITPSLFVQDSIKQLYLIDKSKIKTVPFGVDVNRYKRSKFVNKINQLNFCFVGNVSSRKGLNFLLDVWEDSAFTNDNLHLFGRIYPDIKLRIKNMNYKNIYHYGFVDISKRLAKFDVYIFPSLLEGSSKSIYEAMAAKLTIITTQNSGSIIKNNKDGIIVEAGNTSALKAAMIRVKSKPMLRKVFSENALKKVRLFTWDRYAKSIVNIYRFIS